MIKIIQLAIFFILFSCVQENNKALELFDSENFISWSKSEEISLHSASHFISKKSIERPVGVWELLISFDLENKKECLFYRIPFKKRKGILRVISTKSYNSCAGKFEQEAVRELLDIEKLSVYYNEVKSIFIKKEKLLPRYLGLLIKNKKGETFLRYPFFNIIKRKKYKLYDSPKSETLYPGMFIENKKIESDKKKLKVRGNYFNKTAMLCFGFNKNCQMIKKDTCNICPKERTFSVISYNCPGKKMQFCGDSNCGERGQPACLRGEIFHGLKAEDFCYQDSPAGFCKEGLSTYCDSNHILICL